MSGEEESRLGAWQPVDPARGAAWFSSLETPWWFAGGWALDLHIGRQSRLHADLDVGICRRDFARVREHLVSWEMFEAKDGVLTRLGPGALPRADVHSLWCRPAAATRWMLQLMLDDSAGEMWIYRREPSVRRALSTVVRKNALGLPYLAPEVQLLYKSRRLRPRDQADFEVVAPLLDAAACDWLLDALERCEPGHSWSSALRARRAERPRR